ncbi:hypothetical protein BDI4_840006 [Burkholderia diffusa]|nr:hypothetical protein BDI4_840006 [Burkholderia diffusa]
MSNCGGSETFVKQTCQFKQAKSQYLENI